VLKDGAVVEQGTHEELLLARGLYYSMWQEQATDTFSENSPDVVE
jgi:ABC transporter ATM